MTSRATRTVTSAIDDLATAFAGQVGCTETETPSHIGHPPGSMALRFYPQTHDAGGYDDRPTGPQSNVARAWQNRCELIPSEAEELKRQLIGKMEEGSIDVGAVGSRQAKASADVEVKDWGLPGFPTTPAEQALFVGSLFGGRFGKWGRRGPERPSQGQGEPPPTSIPQKPPSVAKQLELPPGFPRTVEETRNYLHTIRESGFKEMIRQPGWVRLWDQEVKLTIVEYRGGGSCYLYLAFFENKLVSFIMHEGKALSVAEQTTGLQTYLPFTLTHFFPQIFRVPQ